MGKWSVEYRMLSVRDVVEYDTEAEAREAFEAEVAYNENNVSLRNPEGEEVERHYAW